MIITRRIAHLAMISVFLIAGCAKDEFVGVVGICPIVISTIPTTETTDVPLNQIITVTFNVEMNPLTINNTSLLINGRTAIDGIISYSGKTAFFKPIRDLEPNTTYSGKVKTTVKDVTGNAIQQDYLWTFTTGETLAPHVILPDPANNESHVDLNKAITATFNTPMDPSTLNAGSFTIYNGSTPVPGVVTYFGSSARFTPTSPLIINTIYTATVTTDAKDLMGISIANQYVWTFSTFTIVPLKVISTNPFDNETNVSVGKLITATFNEPLNPVSVNSLSFNVRQGANQVAGTLSYSGTTITFKPSNALIGNTTYTVTIKSSISNVLGTHLVSDYIWIFSTGVTLTPTVISTDPSNNAINVLLNKTINTTFNEVMNPLTINSSSFTIRQGTSLVSGTITYSGTTASFKPFSPLLPNKIYTGTITADVKNLNGVSVANDYVWTFTTQTNINPPFVDLKSAGNFGILAGVGIRNNAGFSKIQDLNVGVSPGIRSSIFGFPPAIVVNGSIHASDDINPTGIEELLLLAKNDLKAAYNYTKGASIPTPITISGDQGGLTLTSGIYKSTSSLSIQSGDLTLEAQGDTNAVWIFQIENSFTTVGGAGGSVILKGGAKAANVFWQTGSSATIGYGTSFKGNVLALTSITMNSTATASGRMLAINGSVVMTNTNLIIKP